MTIMIGRFGRDITTPDVSSVKMSGSTVQVSGFFKAASLNAAKVLRQQLSGCVDNRDEPVVPVSCTSDTSLDGFYRVTDASVDVDNGDMGNFRFPWSATLERATASQVASFERTLICGLRTNTSGIVAANMVGFFGIPNTAVSDGISPTWTAASTQTGGALSGATADQVYYLSNPSSLYVSRSGFSPSSPSNYYSDEARLESKWADGSTYYGVSGRDVPARVAASTAIGHDWRLSNGYVRVAPYYTTGATTDRWDLAISHYDGSQWDTAKRFFFQNGGLPYPDSPFQQFAVLRNDPAAVSIRLAAGWNSGVAYYLDLTLRRGASFVEGRWATSSAAGINIGPNTPEAATALTGGIRATSNDASGNRFILASPNGFSSTLASGAISLASATTFDFMIGSEVGGSTPTYFTAQAYIYQYMCAQSETYRIVGR